MRLRAAFAAALSLVLLAAPAQAATYYAKQTATGLGNGSSCANADDLASINAALNAGDICYLCDDSYTTTPVPTNAGTFGSRITYIGNLSDTTAVVFASGWTFSKSYVTVKGVKAKGGIAFSNADRCSLYKASIQDLSFTNGADSNVVANVRGYQASMSSGNHFLSFEGQCWRDTIVNSYFGTGSYSVNSGRWIGGGAAAAGDCSTLDGKWFSEGYIGNSTFECTITGGTDIHFVLFYGIRNSLWYGNRFNFSITGGPTSRAYAWAMRDSSRFVTMRKDTFMLSGTSSDSRWASVALSTDGTCQNSTYGWTWDSCLIKQSDPDGGAIQGSGTDIGDRLTMTHNVIVGGATMGRHDSSVVAHNTFANLNNGAAASWLTTIGGTSWQDATCRYNIFYRDTLPNGATSPIEHHGSETGVWNYNLFYAAKHQTTDTNGRVVSPNCAANICDGTIWDIYDSSYDDSTKWISPQLGDTTSVANFNARPLPGSYAFNVYWSLAAVGAGGYVGAHYDSLVAGPGSTTGTLDQSLGAMTASGTGTVQVKGTTTATLGGVTLTATGSTEAPAAQPDNGGGAKSNKKKRR